MDRKPEAVEKKTTETEISHMEDMFRHMDFASENPGLDARLRQKIRDRLVTTEGSGSAGAQAGDDGSLTCARESGLSSDRTGISAPGAEAQFSRRTGGGAKTEQQGMSLTGLGKNPLEALRNKVKDNQLSMEELEAAAGGAWEQGCEDGRFLNRVFGDDVMPALRDRKNPDGDILRDPARWNTLLTNAWAKGGVTHIFHGDKPAEYYIDGQQVTREQARQHVMNVTGKYV